MKKFRILTFILTIVLFSGSAFAGNFSAVLDNLRVEGHAGIGAIRYEEHASPADPEPKLDDSEATLDAVLFGLSGEYTFPKPRNFYAVIKADWIWGSEDNEKWKKKHTIRQTNDLSITSEFYDVSLGHKNNLGRFYYRLFISGGWDGIHFRRKNLFDGSGNVIPSDTITEDFSLWRVGGGLASGYEINKWAFEVNAAYGYYYDAHIKNSAFGGVSHHTTGDRLDADLVVSRDITDRIKAYLGGSYIFIEMKEDKKAVTFPNSETQILIALLKLSYAFK